MSDFSIKSGNVAFKFNIDDNQLLIDGKIIAQLSFDNLGFAFIPSGNGMKRALIRKNSDTSYEVWIKNHRIPFEITQDEPEFVKLFTKSGHDNHTISINAPMPGLVVAIEVEVGDMVKSGAGLIILEAMKMENEIKASVNAKVKQILVQNKTKVEKGQPLLILTTE